MEKKDSRKVGDSAVEFPNRCVSAFVRLAKLALAVCCRRLLPCSELLGGLVEQKDGRDGDKDKQLQQRVDPNNLNASKC